MKKIIPHILIIMDGVGINEETRGNAFKQAKKPNLDKLFKKYPNTHIKTSGMAVGLPEGQMGNSEVGHTNIGAGRIIYQKLTKISKDIQDGIFFENEEFKKAIENVKKNNSSLHIMGLVSDGGVHSHIEHLEALVELAHKNNIDKVYIHAFMDGRDTGIYSGKGYIEELESKVKNKAKVATVVGRYYAMDRDKRYERLKLAYDLIVNSVGEKSKSATKALEKSYEETKNEDNKGDEFVKPYVIVDKDENSIASIKDNDSVIFFNFRPDRARELSHILTDEKYDGFERENLPKNLFFVTMAEYDETLKNVHVAYKNEVITNTLGEIASKNNINQLRIAETEKYAHVTFFFNGGEEKQYSGEDRILVPSPKVATYDLKPEMSAYEVTDKVIEAIEKDKYGLIIMNYANGDMVGHTGVLEKAIVAVETVDECVGRVIEKIVEKGGEAIITADHGNCEEMLNLETGEVITTHSTFDVPMIVVSDRVKEVKPGRLCDLSPTMLDLMGIDKPVEMTGESLVVLK